MGESGGLFLGRHLNESGNIFIDQITSPSDEDKATKTSFWRSSVHWYKAIDIWKKEKETCAYIGQWHTHPEKTPNPSCVDTNEWMKSLKQDTYHDKYLYFMIIGVDVIRVWQNDLINGFSELERL
ncbi:Mov34/MPN/PAD-1 family protein [bacterium]|nr:Mov34/MPN/PAD-1 family protein [bacterium]